MRKARQTARKRTSHRIEANEQEATAELPTSEKIIRESANRNAESLHPTGGR